MRTCSIQAHLVLISFIYFFAFCEYAMLVCFSLMKGEESRIRWKKKILEALTTETNENLPTCFRIFKYFFHFIPFNKINLFLIRISFHFDYSNSANVRSFSLINYEQTFLIEMISLIIHDVCVWEIIRLRWWLSLLSLKATSDNFWLICSTIELTNAIFSSPTSFTWDLF